MSSGSATLRNGSTKRCSRKYIAGKHNEAGTGIKQSSAGTLRPQRARLAQTTESKAGRADPQSNQHPSREMFAC